MTTAIQTEQKSPYTGDPDHDIDLAAFHLGEALGVLRRHAVDPRVLGVLSYAARILPEEALMEHPALKEKARQAAALLVHCPDEECARCSEIMCPHGDALHFHHDGCPSCAGRA